MIDIVEYDVATVRRMVAFLYKGDYDVDDTAPVQDATERPPTPAEAPNKSPAPPKVEDKDKTFDDLRSHIMVNSIAAHYDIKGLTELVSTKIQKLLQTVKGTRKLTKFIQLMSISKGCATLHSTIAPRLAVNIEKLADSETFVSIDLDKDLSKQLLRSCALRIKELHKQVAAHKAALIKESAAKQTLQITVNNFNKVIKTLGNTSSCRNCREKFSCYIESKDASLPAFLLRCNKCLCRHPKP